MRGETPAAIEDFLLGEWEMAEADRHVIVEEAPQRALDLGIVAGPHDLRRARRHRRDPALARDLDAGFEDAVRRAEHRLDIGLPAIDRDIGHGAGRQSAAIGKAEDARRPGTRHDGDLAQAVLATEPAD